jgi:hypothetical protein
VDLAAGESERQDLRDPGIPKVPAKCELFRSR